MLKFYLLVFNYKRTVGSSLTDLLSIQVLHALRLMLLGGDGVCTDNSALGPAVRRV